MRGEERGRGGGEGKPKTHIPAFKPTTDPSMEISNPLTEQVTPPRHSTTGYRWFSVTVFCSTPRCFGWFVRFPPTYNPNRGRQHALRRLRSARRRMQGTLLARLANDNTEEATLKTLSLYYCIDRTTRRRRMTGAAVCGVRGDKMEVKKCYFIGEEKLVLRTSNTNRRGS